MKHMYILIHSHTQSQTDTSIIFSKGTEHNKEFCTQNLNLNFSILPLFFFHFICFSKKVFWQFESVRESAYRGKKFLAVVCFFPDIRI